MIESKVRLLKTLFTDSFYSFRRVSLKNRFFYLNGLGRCQKSVTYFLNGPILRLAKNAVVAYASLFCIKVLNREKKNFDKKISTQFVNQKAVWCPSE